MKITKGVGLLLAMAAMLLASCGPAKYEGYLASVKAYDAAMQKEITDIPKLASLEDYKTYALKTRVDTVRKQGLMSIELAKLQANTKETEMTDLLAVADLKAATDSMLKSTQALIPLMMQVATFQSTLDPAEFLKTTTDQLAEIAKISEEMQKLAEAVKKP